MKAASTYETPVNLCQTTLRYNPDGGHLFARLLEV
jgi:hypothetical protein